MSKPRLQSLSLPVAPEVIESFRRLAELGLCLGGELALAGEIIAARFSSLPSDRIKRRDDALLDLAWICRRDRDDEPSDRTVAEEVVERLREYERGPWKSDRAYAAPSLSTSEERRALFVVLKETGGRAPGLSTIRGALSGANRLANFSAVAAGHGSRPSLAATKRHANRRAKLLMTADRPKADLGEIKGFFEELRRSPAGQKIAEDGRAKIVAERKKLIDQLAAIDAEAEAWGRERYGKVGQAKDAAVAKRVTDAVAELKNAQHAADAHRAANYGKTIDFARRRGIVELPLLDGEHMAAIDAFVSWCRDDERATRKKFFAISEELTNPNTRKTEVLSIRTNKDAVAARIAALRAATECAEKMRLDADPSTVAARLKAMKEALPIVEGRVIENAAKEPV